MATAKKAAVKKSTRKVAAKKVPANKVPTRRPKALPLDIVETTDPVDPPEAKVATAVKKRAAGRPVGARGRKKGKAGRKAAQEFLYSIRNKPTDDDGLDDGLTATAVAYVGPFSSEAEATSAALDEVGNKKDIEIVVFRDFRRGTPETKVRLVS